MSTNCIQCVVNPRTSHDLLCDECREQKRKSALAEQFEKHQAIKAEGFAGLSRRTGFLCDRREEPDALPIPANTLLGVPEPKPLPGSSTLTLPLLPPLPAGFDRWIYRGMEYRRPDAYMWTSFDERQDQQWDPPMFMNSEGSPGCHYIEAVINHDVACECGQCMPR